MKNAHLPTISYNCPACGKSIDCHHCVEDPAATPKEDDLLICSYCRSISEVTDSRRGLARKLDRKELGRLPSYMVRNIERIVKEMEHERSLEN